MQRAVSSGDVASKRGLSGVVSNDGAAQRGLSGVVSNDGAAQRGLCGVVSNDGAALPKRASMIFRDEKSEIGAEILYKLLQRPPSGSAKPTSDTSRLNEEAAPHALRTL